ncbi:Crp/Fnr family transcriptional regulator [Alteromonadaceae bacterium M269]|nr:Crp/Fnr family transcriptional regulator [Alteromonadaceae bacterium M269]
MAINAERQLDDNEWLNTLTKPVKAELIRAAKIKHFISNQRIHSKGDMPDGLYCVISGEIRVCATTLSGGEFIFTKIQPGSWFGEIAILDNGPRTHDGYSVNDSTIAVIPKSTIQMLCDQDNNVYRALVSMLCSHCRQAFKAIDEMLIHSNEQRLANLLISRLSTTSTSKLTINQEELGAQIGLSRQSINKLLKKWKQLGWIKLHYGGIEVTNMNALTACTRE